MCLWVQRRGQKVRLIPQRIKMDKRKALALLCGVVSQEPTAFENLYSLFLGLREVRTKEDKGCGVKGKVRQLSKPCFLESPHSVPVGVGLAGEATVAMLRRLQILKLLILTPHEHNDSLEGFRCMLDTLITPSPQDLSSSRPTLHPLCLFCAHTEFTFE